MRIASDCPAGFGTLGVIGELPMVQLAAGLAGPLVARGEGCLLVRRGDGDREGRRALCVGCLLGLGLDASPRPLTASSVRFSAFVTRTNPSRAPRGMPVVFLDLGPPVFFLAGDLRAVLAVSASSHACTALGMDFLATPSKTQARSGFVTSNILPLAPFGPSTASAAASNSSSLFNASPSRP